MRGMCGLCKDTLDDTAFCLTKCGDKPTTCDEKFGRLALLEPVTIGCKQNLKDPTKSNYRYECGPRKSFIEVKSQLATAVEGALVRWDGLAKKASYPISLRGDTIMTVKTAISVPSNNVNLICTYRMENVSINLHQHQMEMHQWEN